MISFIRLKKVLEKQTNIIKNESFVIMDIVINFSYLSLT